MNSEIHLAPLSRAAQVADHLINLGVPAAYRKEIIVLVGEAILQAEDQARQEERQRITAEWLTQMLPGEVITMAAEKVAARAY